MKSSFSTLENNLEYFSYLLNQVLVEYDKKIAALYQKIVALTIKARKDGKLESYEEIDRVINALSASQLTSLAKALTVYFHLANISEENNRIERLREYESESKVKGVNNALGMAFLKLNIQIGKAKALSQIQKLQFHPVLTAHPTEARRISTNQSIKRITNLIVERKSKIGISLMDNERALLYEIDQLFKSSPIENHKPSPVEENQVVANVFDDTFFNSIPEIYQRLDNFISFRNNEHLGLEPPKVKPFIQLGSWIGSDRDGNLSVTNEVTYKVARENYQHIIHTYIYALESLANQLTINTANSKVPVKLLALKTRLENELGNRVNGGFEVFKYVCNLLGEKLERTLDDSFAFRYADPAEFLADLRIVQSSLAELHDPRLAYGKLQWLIWQVESFGFHLVQLEIRQHSQIHQEAIDDINENGLERAKLKKLTVQTLETFVMMLKAQQAFGPKILRKYIVSFTRGPKDILNVISLAKFALHSDFKKLQMDIVPLLETQNDLENAIKVLAGLQKTAAIRDRVKVTGNSIEVMLGYSDSSKEIGPVAATLMIHKTQRDIAAWAKKQKLVLTLFHGRGGAMGRGGGPAHRAVLSQPKGSIENRFKITEQGETIAARYGNPDIAVRHIESVASSTLLASLDAVANKNEAMFLKYEDFCGELSNLSSVAYRDLVNREGFVEWFNAVTPLEEVGLLPLGSRPIKRGLSSKEIEDLRAIPWVFAWSQARINLAAWYGFGSACENYASNLQNANQLSRAYKEWNFFATLVDNIEMSIAKTDENIASFYFGLSKNQEFPKAVMNEMRLTKKWLKKITGNSTLLHSHPVLSKAIKIRSPYIDALSMIQVNNLKKIRAQKSKGVKYDELLYLIHCTVSGVSAGLQNTG